MAFKFRLQKILDLKEKAEENKKNEVAIVLKDIKKKEEEIEELKKQRQIEVTNREKCSEEGCVITKIIDINKYIKYLEQSIDLAIEELENLNDMLKTKQDEYIEARKEKKSFEKLREKELEKFNKEEAKKEEKVIDQIVTFASSKK